MHYKFLSTIFPACLTAALLLPLLLTACATTGAARGERPIDQLKTDLDALQVETLDNGLALMLSESHKVPLVTIVIAVRAGAFVEDEEYDGLSHLYEHMFFKGNRAIPNQEAYLKRVRELGMSFNGGTSTEVVMYYFTLPSDNLEVGLRFMYDAVTGPIFDPVELDRERQVVLSEYDGNEASPYFHYGQAIDRALFSRYPSRKNVIGSRSLIESATREKMMEMQRRYYVPGNSAIIISGDIEPENTAALATKVFSEWLADPERNTPPQVPEHPPLEKNVDLIIEQPFQNVLISLNWHGPSVGVDDEATYAADIFSFILSQNNSNFRKHLVDSGLLLDASLSYYTQRHVGPIGFQGMAESGRGEEARVAMEKEIQRFTESDYYSDAEMEQARLKLAVNSLYERESSLGFARTLGFWWSVSSVDYLRNYITNLGRVDRAAIYRYIEKYIQNAPRVTAVMKAPAAVAPEVSAEGKGN